jgi:AraC-like DNA-binding protein
MAWAFHRAYEKLGLTQQELLDSLPPYGMTLAELADPKTRLPQALMLSDFERYAHRFGRSDIGLLAAQASMPGDFGAVELAARACATLGQALVTVAHGYGLIADGSHLSVEQRGEHAVARFWTDPDHVLPTAVSEFELLSVLRLISSYVGERVQPDFVRFAHPKVPHATACEEAFGCRIEFDSVENAIFFPHALLDAKLLTANRLAAGMWRERVDALVLESTGSDLVARVEQAVTDKLSQGLPSIASVALALGTSERSLHRNLTESGTSYREVCDRLRLRLALHYLESSDLSIKEIASALGFYEVSSFHRAYKRMTGSTPQQRRGDREP